MAKLSILAGATSQSVNVFVRDSSSTTGAGLAAIAPAGGSLLAGTKLYYSFTGANASAGVAVSLAVLAAVNSAYSSAGIVTLDATNMIGWVRIDIPNAALATSSGRVVSFHLYGGTNMAPTPFEIELTATNNQSATAFITGVNSLAPPASWNTDIVQTGDAYARIGAAGAGLTAVVAASVTGNVGGNVTGSVGSVTGSVGSVTGLTASNLDATVSSRATPAQILTTAITEAYRANGVAPTLAQFICEVLAQLGEQSISGTTKTIKKLDHSTTAETFTLDSATAPTSITRAT